MASQEITNTLENRLNKFSHFSHWPSSMFTAVVGSKSFRFKLILVLRIFYKSYDTQETKLLVYDLLTINCFLTQFLLGKQYTSASDTSGLATWLELASRVPVDVTHTSSNRSIECLACDDSIPIGHFCFEKITSDMKPHEKEPRSCETHGIVLILLESRTHGTISSYNKNVSFGKPVKCVMYVLSKQMMVSTQVVTSFLKHHQI